MDRVNGSLNNPTDSDAVYLAALYKQGRDRMRTAALSSQQLGAVLRKAVEDAVAGDDYSMLVLRLAVECFTADLRDDGMMPEAVLVALKKIVLERKDSAGMMLRDQINTWFLGEFFTAQSPMTLHNPPEGMTQ
jgi:hypothetical protein